MAASDLFPSTGHRGRSANRSSLMYLPLIHSTEMAIRLRGFVAAVAVTCTPFVAHAQVVQLPTVGTSGYSGTVVVPDRGSLSLGGNASSRYSRYLYGRPRSRVLGSEVGAGNTSVSAHLIDLEELDRQILSGAPGAGKHRTLRASAAPVADVYSRPAASESSLPPQRRSTLRDFSGDYLLLLSHPQLAAASQPAASATPRTAGGKTENTPTSTPATSTPRSAR